MKFREFFPEIQTLAQTESKVSFLVNTLEQETIRKSGETYRTPTLGLDQIVNLWVRQNQAYRQSLLQDLQMIAMTVEEIRGPVNHIVSEVFRRGIDWKPAFAAKCAMCRTEFKDAEPVCLKCKSEEMLEPDEAQKEGFEAFLSDCNVFDQSLEEVLREFHFDLNTIDDGYLYLSKEYKELGDRSVNSKIISIERLNPALVEIDLDEQGLPKKKHFVCYIHRDPIDEKAMASVNASLPMSAGFCSAVLDDGGTCGRKKIPSMYIYRSRGKMLFLLDSEVIHVSKFNPTKTYGWSPILTIFEKAMTIIGMDKTLYRYFFERKVPSSMVMVFTDDVDSLRTERENIVHRMRADPEGYIPMIGVSSKTNRGRVDMVRMFHTLQEMDYLPVREEIRERIAAMWGVTPAWQGAPEAFGGLSTQTQQLVVMSRVVEGDQRIFHEKIFPELLKAFDITDWELELQQPEEEAEATRLMLAQQKVGMAIQLSQVPGVKLKIKSQNVGITEIDFVVSGELKNQADMMAEQQQQQMGGGMGGEMGGMVPGQPGAELPPENQGIEDMPEEIQNMITSNPSSFKPMLGQIMEKGYVPSIRRASNDLSKVWFLHNGEDYVAEFSKGQLMNVSKATFNTRDPRMPKREAREITPPIQTLSSDGNDE